MIIGDGGKRTSLDNLTLLFDSGFEVVNARHGISQSRVVDLAGLDQVVRLFAQSAPEVVAIALELPQLEALPPAACRSLELEPTPVDEAPHHCGHGLGNRRGAVVGDRVSDVVVVGHDHHP